MGLLPIWIHDDLDDFIQGLQPETLSDLFRTGAQIFGALLGFVMAALAILLTLGQTESIRKLYRTRRSRDIFRMYTMTSTWLGIATVLCIVGLVFNRRADLGWPVPWAVLWVSVVALWRLGWSVWILGQVVELVVGDHAGTGEPPATGSSDVHRGIE
jgi:hypothetical protein